MKGATAYITVVGTSGVGLTPEQERLVGEAALVVGGERHLVEAGVEAGRSVVLKGDLSAAMGRIENEEGGPVVVLASGDPGFFGIVRLLSERFGAGRLDVRPSPSSVSLAFGRAGISWEDAVVVSVHGEEPVRGTRRAMNVCRANPKVAVLTGPKFGPGEVAGELRDLGREFVVCERLGAADERVFRGGAEEIARGGWRDPNVVLVLDPGRTGKGKTWISGSSRSGGGWGMPVSEFEYRSAMITKPEARSLVLAKLGPNPGDLVWDVGAGSGSVAVECARFGAATMAVERDPASCENVRQNARRHGVYVEVVEGEAPEALEGLPEPDAVFIGGSGGDFEEIVGVSAGRAARAVVLTLITLERVVPATRLLGECGYEVETVMLQTSRLSGIAKMNRLVPESQVFVIAGVRK